jgi:hypothetical protein
LEGIRHLVDLRATGRKRWPSVTPSDVLRRADALQRANALAVILPVWPNAPLPPPGFERRMRDIGHTIFDENPSDPYSAFLASAGARRVRPVSRFSV